MTEAFDKLREQKTAEFAQELADALGKDVDAVKDALEQERQDHEARHEAMRAEFAAKLAKALGIPESRVKDALDSMPHPPRHGP